MWMTTPPASSACAWRGRCASLRRARPCGRRDGPCGQHQDEDFFGGQALNPPWAHDRRLASLHRSSGPELFRKMRYGRDERRGHIMNKKLLAGLAAVGLLAGGGSATALAATGAPAAATSTAAVGSSISRAPSCGPLGSLVTRGTITQAQAIAIHNAFASYLHGHWRSMLDTVLGKLVK